jgi:hypothetical protein
MPIPSHRDKTSRGSGFPRTVLHRALLSMAGATGPLAATALQWWLHTR